MIEQWPDKSPKPAPKTFTIRYRSSVGCAVVWFGILAFWCGAVMDMGESFQTFLYALGVYVVLLLLILLRRPTTPSKLDLLLIGWGLPILFFSLLLLLPLVWRLRHVD